MKDGSDAEFVKAITQSGLGVVERLPKNCKATHVFRVQGKETVLPIKYMHENNSGGWNLHTVEYRGVVVLWIHSQRAVFVTHTSKLTTGRTRSSSIVRQYHVDSPDTFVIKILSAFRDYGVVMTDVLAITKYKVVSRKETLLRPSTNGLEAQAHEEILALVGSDHWKETPEKCRADAVFYIDNPDCGLPVQTKSCTLKKDGKTFNLFHNTSGYDSMVLLCRPMTRLYIGTLVLPGKLAPKHFTLFLAEGSKYLPYLVPDTQLHTFLTSLHAAVANGIPSHTWPGGKRVDISDIKLVTYGSLCMPHYATDMVERQNHEWRLTVLPNFTYETPKVQGTTVDVIINGVRVQDKSAHAATDHKGFPVSMTKNSGRDGKKSGTKTSPYAVGDFEAMFVFPPDKTRYFFLIPATALQEQKVLSYKGCKGKTAIVCYFPDYRFAGLGRPPNLWTQKHCYDLQDPAVHSKIASLLKHCKTVGTHRHD